MNLERPRIARLASALAIDRMLRVSRIKLSFTLTPISTPLTWHWNFPPLATLSPALKYTSRMLIIFVRANLVNALRALTPIVYNFFTPSRNATAASRVRLAAYTIPLAMWTAALAISSTCLLFLTITIAALRTKSSGFLSSQQAAFFAVHIGSEIRLQQPCQPGRLQTHLRQALAQQCHPRGHPIHSARN